MTKGNLDIESSALPAYLVKLYIVVLVSLFSLACISVLLYPRLLHRGYPYNTFLFMPGLRFSDWTNLVPRVAHHGEADMLSAKRSLGIYPYPYPLPSLYVYLLFIRAGAHSLRTYLLAAILSLVAAGAGLYWRLHRLSHALLPGAAIVLTLLLGSPGIHLLDRANIEIFIWLLVLLGMVAYFRRWFAVAALLFATAGAMKIYPLIYLLLFLRHRQWRFAALGFGFAGLASLFALWEVGPTIGAALQQTQAAGIYLRDAQVNALDLAGLRFDHSLLGLLKMASLHLAYWSGHPPTETPTYDRLAFLYTLVAPVLLAALFFGRVIRLPLLNRFAALLLLSILFPFVSYEYTLVHIYTLAGVLLIYLWTDVREGRVHLQRTPAILAVLCLAGLGAPLSFSVMSQWSGQVKCLALLLLLGILLSFPMRSTLFGDLEEAEALSLKPQLAPYLNRFAEVETR